MFSKVFVLLITLLSGVAMSYAEQGQPSPTDITPAGAVNRWVLADESLTKNQATQLTAVYQLMLNAQYTEAEQQLAQLAAEAPAVLPLWVALLTEQQQFAKIRQLHADGLLASTHSSVVMAQAYANTAQPIVRFVQDQKQIALKSHWLVSLPRVKVQLKDRFYYFVLDTGASQSLVTDKVVRDLALPLASASKLQIDTATANTVMADLVRLPDFNLGPVVAQNQPAVVVKSAELEQRFLGLNWYQLDGIIGWPIIKQLDLTIDFANNILDIQKPQAEAKRGNLVWLFDDPMVITAQQGQSHLWFLDTGAMESQLSADYLNDEQLQAMNWQSKKFNGLGGKGEHEQTGQFGPLKIAFPSLIQHFKQLTVRAGHQDCQHSRCDGRLGVDVANNLRMHINFQTASFDISRAK